MAREFQPTRQSPGNGWDTNGASWWGTTPAFGDSLEDQPSKAITSFARNEFVHPSKDRFLTLRECARIQTFPDTFEFAGKIADQALPIGNAVPPLFAEVVARHLAAQLRVGVKQDAGEGRLLSFVPTMSSEMSPALQRITTVVQNTFSVTAANTQLQLWR